MGLTPFELERRCHFELARHFAGKDIRLILAQLQFHDVARAGGKIDLFKSTQKVLGVRADSKKYNLR